MDSLSGYFSSFCTGLSNFFVESQTPFKDDKKKMDRARNFFLKNERAILFTFSIGVQLFTSPRLLAAGAAGGTYLEIKYGNTDFMKNLKTHTEILSLFEASIALIGAGGSIICQIYTRQILQLSPLLTGLSLGSVGVKLWVRNGSASGNDSHKRRHRNKRNSKK